MHVWASAVVPAAAATAGTLRLLGDPWTRAVAAGLFAAVLVFALYALVVWVRTRRSS